MVMTSLKRRMVRLSKMILSSSVGVGGGVRMGIIVTEDAGDDSIEVVVVVSPVISSVIVVGVRVVGLRGAAMLFVVSVFSATGFSLSGQLFVFRGFKRSLFLRLFLLSWSHRGGYRGRG